MSMIAVVPRSCIGNVSRMSAMHDLGNGIRTDRNECFVVCMGTRTVGLVGSFITRTASCRDSAKHKYVTLWLRLGAQPQPPLVYISPVFLINT